MDKEVIISFEDFGFQYTAQAEPTLFDINLKIRKGERVLIAGPSGCGKSTLAHCINGMAPGSYPGKSKGKLMVGGKDALELGLFGLSKVVGTVLQDSDGQFIGLTVAEDIAFALENDCIPTGDMHREVEKIAQLVDVERVLKHAPHEISGGQKQQVSLGGVMVGQVDVLLFDEPLANLDSATGKQAIVLIDEIQKRTGCAVIIIEHRVEDFLYRPVDRIVVMGDGRVQYDGDPDTLLCSDLLQEKGIREPLYVTALKYAGVTLTPDMRPSYLPELTLSEDQKQQVRSWFEAQPQTASDLQQEVLLRVKNLDFTYDNSHHALRGIGATVHKGEMLSIVGTNGAGKSTFAKVICGFEKAQKGILELKGVDLNTLSIKEWADHIGYVMQNPNQMISKTKIFDEVALGLRNQGVAEEEIRHLVEKTLKICGLYPFRNWPVSALSYGQKKRITIASILVLDPEMINLYNCIDRPSRIHQLTGACKLVCLITLSLAAMTTFYTPLLLAMTLASFLLFRCAKLKLKDISFVLGLMIIYIALNNLLIFLFSPDHGAKLYESETILFKIAGPYVVTAQQARGTEMSKKASLVKRLRAAGSSLIPLILSSMERIETVSNAMELRGFGKDNKRTWYSGRKFSKLDFFAWSFVCC